MPAIIDKDDFYMAQQIFEKRFNEKVRAGNERIHKYAGILKCGKCGKGFVARNSKRRAEDRVVTYVCSTFHKFGAQYCGSHRVMEEDLDEIILGQLNELLYTAEVRLNDMDKTIEDRLSKKRDYDKQAEKARISIHKKEEEIKGYSRQLAQGFINEKMFLELTADANRELAKLGERLSELEGLAESGEHEKESIIKSIDVMREIISNKALTNTSITMLIDKIVVQETEEMGEYNRPKIDIEVFWNTPFMIIRESMRLAG